MPIFLFSVFGFYIFGDIDKDNFETLSRSFVSLFVLLTTAKYVSKSEIFSESQFLRNVLISVIRMS